MSLRTARWAISRRGYNCLPHDTEVPKEGEAAHPGTGSSIGNCDWPPYQSVGCGCLSLGDFTSVAVCLHLESSLEGTLLCPDSTRTPASRLSGAAPVGFCWCFEHQVDDVLLSIFVYLLLFSLLPWLNKLTHSQPKYGYCKSMDNWLNVTWKTGIFL